MNSSLIAAKLRSLFVVVIACTWCVVSAHGQSTDAAGDSQEAARREILESDRWRRAEREMNEWLSVQTLYGEEEVTAIRARLRESMATKSPRELEDLLKDMENRLEVLMSPEAEDAREWLQDFLRVARNPEQQLGRQKPDVLNMTASQIRAELRWLQQTREQRQQAQAAFQQGRAVRSQAAPGARAARRPVNPPITNRADWPSNNPRRPSQYAPQQELRPEPLPRYLVSPWGHPIHWVW
jgi:hypothetical protein